MVLQLCDIVLVLMHHRESSAYIRIESSEACTDYKGLRLPIYPFTPKPLKPLHYCRNGLALRFAAPSLRAEKVRGTNRFRVSGFQGLSLKLEVVGFCGVLRALGCYVAFFGVRI